MHSFTVITPSRNMLQYLKRCVASVKDQPIAGDVRVHHHIQDADSTDGTCEFLAAYANEVTELPNYQFSFASEPDAGMYDAINKGGQILNASLSSSERAQRICAYLNCDEQYLPGTMEFVADYFHKHPDIDILFGDSLLVDEKGVLLSFRKGYTPRKIYIEASHLYNLSCATFARVRVWERISFDPAFTACGDEQFVTHVLAAGFKATHVRRYLATFTFREKIMSRSEGARREYASMKNNTPPLVKLARPLLNVMRLTEKLISGAYAEHFPLRYAIYGDNLDKRTKFESKRVSFRWPDG